MEVFEAGMRAVFGWPPEMKFEPGIKRPKFDMHMDMQIEMPDMKGMMGGMMPVGMPEMNMSMPDINGMINNAMERAEDMLEGNGGKPVPKEMFCGEVEKARLEKKVEESTFKFKKATEVARLKTAEEERLSAYIKEATHAFGLFSLSWP